MIPDLVRLKSKFNVDATDDREQAWNDLTAHIADLHSLLEAAANCCDQLDHDDNCYKAMYANKDKNKQNSCVCGIARLRSAVSRIQEVK